MAVELEPMAGEFLAYFTDDLRVIEVGIAGIADFGLGLSEARAWAVSGTFGGHGGGPFGWDMTTIGLQHHTAKNLLPSRKSCII